MLSSVCERGGGGRGRGRWGRGEWREREGKGEGGAERRERREGWQVVCFVLFFFASLTPSSLPPLSRSPSPPLTPHTHHQTCKAGREMRTRLGSLCVHSLPLRSLSSLPSLLPPLPSPLPLFHRHFFIKLRTVALCLSHLSRRALLSIIAIHRGVG